jgi:hypothetical protein
MTCAGGGVTFPKKTSFFPSAVQATAVKANAVNDTPSRILLMDNLDMSDSFYRTSWAGTLARPRIIAEPDQKHLIEALSGGALFQGFALCINCGRTFLSCRT